MKKLFILCLIAGSVILSGCKTTPWIITSATSTRIPVDKSLDAIADSSYIKSILPVKNQIDTKMDIVIGEATETMQGYAPESLLSNFNADVYKQKASDFLKKPVDIAIVNLGGLRTVIPAGNITIRKVFELMPFENQLVILWLKGSQLNDLCQYFASMGGEGVAGIRLTIDKGKATDITIDGMPIDKNKTYTIATNDYLAGGNDKMVQLAMSEKRLDTGVKIRDMLIDYIKNETANGRKIESRLDGRISIKR